MSDEHPTSILARDSQLMVNPAVVLFIAGADWYTPVLRDLGIKLRNPTGAKYVAEMTKAYAEHIG